MSPGQLGRPAAAAVELEFNVVFVVSPLDGARDFCSFPEVVCGDGFVLFRLDFSSGRRCRS